MADFAIPPVSEAVLDSFSPVNRACIKRLIATSRERPDLSSYPQSKLGAVLILLYEEAGELRVLLTTRSKTLRTHPGQTALPGGKVDDTDTDFIETAYREAHEEVGLPLNSPDVFTVAVLEPAISLYKIVVTPVVAILTRPSLLNELKAEESEVFCIFTHPLQAVLDPTLARSEQLADIGSENWPYEVELHSTSDSSVALLGNMMYRMHRFRSSASPIKGLTADLLIQTAKIVFGHDPTYEQYAAGQLRKFKQISALVINGSNQIKELSG